MTRITRKTRETEIELTLDASPERNATIATGEPFLDHMLTTLTRYSGLALDVRARGDLRHHLVEDVGITLGLALRERIPETCARFGHAVIPMDDALVEAALDAGGRFYFEGRLPSPLYEHFLRSCAEQARMTLHVRVLRGRDRHHVVEAAFKAFGLALRQAMVESGAVFSTKGSVSIELEGNDAPAPASDGPAADGLPGTGTC